MFKDKDCHLEFGVHFCATVGPLVHHALRLCTNMAEAFALAVVQ